VFECPICGRIGSADIFYPFCPEGHGPLFAARLPETRDRPRSIRPECPHPLERYRDFLPLEDVDLGLSLGEGNTPLVRLTTLERSLGGFPIFAKNEAQNPTGSFKDRGTAVAIQRARSLGFRRIGTVSTGNMAASTAAYGSRAGLETIVLLKEGTPEASLGAAGIYGPKLVTVRGDYGRLFRKSLEIGRELGIYFMNSVDPFRLEGYKITGFEIFAGLGGRPPGYLFVPLSSGGHLLGLMRAFDDLLEEGLAEAYPTFVGVQASGCAPLAEAFEAGSETYAPWRDVRTSAHAISNPCPPAGGSVLRMIREHAGILLHVSDEEMLRARKALASEEGLFCQLESAAALAGLKKLREKKNIPREGPAVLVLTGSGLKRLPSREDGALEVHEFGLDHLHEGLSRLI
jgi:threonine synthase